MQSSVEASAMEDWALRSPLRHGQSQFWYTLVFFYICDRDLGFRENTLSYCHS